MTKINSWTRANIFLGCAVSLWLVALAPVGKLGKGTALTLTLCSTIQLIRESKELILTEAVAIANAAMQKELTQTEIALRTHQTEQELQHLYSANPAYPPEVVDELRDSLEALVTADAAEQDTETSTSENKELYLAVKALLDSGKSETFVVEEVLKMGGRNWEEGKKLLQSILDLGQKENWK